MTAAAHPLRVRVQRLDVVDGEPWAWSVWRYADRNGQRWHLAHRWGSCSRWDDAIASGRAALAAQVQDEIVKGVAW